MPSDAHLWQTWQDAAANEHVITTLNHLLEHIDQQVALSGFTCQQSGRCCKFESFGHRLYMSGLEIAAFKLRAGNPVKASQTESIPLPQFDPKQDGCPYQIDGLCSVHQVRSFACRVFFCQEGSDDWQSQQYEAFQEKIKKLHEENNIPYRYMEWRQGLTDAANHGL